MIVYILHYNGIVCLNLFRLLLPEFPLYLDQVNTGSVAGDLESGTPVPQEVPENVQVTIKKDFKITLEVSCIMILNIIFERDPI